MVSLKAILMKFDIAFVLCLTELHVDSHSANYHLVINHSAPSMCFHCSLGIHTHENWNCAMLKMLNQALKFLNV